jgi:hypothetical protein
VWYPPLQLAQSRLKSSFTIAPVEAAGSVHLAELALHISVQLLVIVAGEADPSNKQLLPEL